MTIIEISRRRKSTRRLRRNMSSRAGHACLQGTRYVEEDALVTINLVHEATLESFPRMIEALLSVAHPIEQPARKRPRAAIEPPLKIVREFN